MIKATYLILILFCLSIFGCSMPITASQKQLYTFTKQEKKLKGGLGKKKIVLIKDFRENEVYEEDITALKEEVERYISTHPDLSEPKKSNLRELKVMEEATKEEIILLLGKPDKIIKAGGAGSYNASRIWVYKINKIRAFTIFIIPVLFVHEAYYLYFKDDFLAGIERHSLKQIVKQGQGPGLFQSKEKISTQ